MYVWMEPLGQKPYIARLACALSPANFAQHRSSLTNKCKRSGPKDLYFAASQKIAFTRTVDDINLALPIIRKIYHNSHSLGSLRLCKI